MKQGEQGTRAPELRGGLWTGLSRCPGSSRPCSGRGWRGLPWPGLTGSAQVGLQTSPCLCPRPIQFGALPFSALTEVAAPLWRPPGSQTLDRLLSNLLRKRRKEPEGFPPREATTQRGQAACGGSFWLP